ncbi:hypothetical protein TRSC58_05453 [Trypanosoma rangeli SC58]|uniref:Clp ATPase C-terminal domain-containing protein n=1 Tax=Trypanosoma rangeli SC58 TaxID=429131 RepID=A0A061IYA0_TRYRA|nr:hypothetical protein TRSC58_05453 [Trypanosoma rangeli SC58]
MTSNLGSEHLVHLSNSPGVWAATREKVMQVVRRYFRPEFVNRLDDIVLFRRLGFGELHDIIDIIIAGVNERLKAHDIRLEITDEVKNFVLDSAFDAEMGARPLRRWVEKHITTEVSRMILSQQLPPNSTVKVSVNSGQGKLAFSVKRSSSS